MENPKSFGVEEAIAQWRAGFEHSAALRPADVDELEAHLRDAIRAQQARGAGEEAAFTAAVQDLGSGSEISHEFAKTNRKLIGMNRILWMLIGWTLFLWLTAPGEILGALAKDAAAGLSAKRSWPAMVYIGVTLLVEITAWLALGWYCAKHIEKLGRWARFFLSHPWAIASGLIALNLAHTSLESELIKCLRNLIGIQVHPMHAFDPGTFESIAWNIAASDAAGLLYLGAFALLLWRYLRQARGEQLRFPTLSPEAMQWRISKHEQARPEVWTIWHERCLGMAAGAVFLRFILIPGYDWLVVVAMAFLPMGGALSGLAMVALQCAAFIGVGWLIWKHSTQWPMGFRRLETTMLKWPTASAVGGIFALIGAKAGLLLTGLVINRFSNPIHSAGWNFSTWYNGGFTFWISIIPVLLLLAFAYFHIQKNSDDPFLIN